MRVSIYQADVPQLTRQRSLTDLLAGLPVALHERAQRYQLERDALNFVVGRLMLQRGLQELGLEEQLTDIRYLPSGKPWLEQVSFSISHTDDRVLCALSPNAPLGIDLEKIKPVGLAHFEPWFTASEWLAICTAPAPLQTFYGYWTRKESIIKALGVSLDYLHQIELDPTREYFVTDGQKWHLRHLDLGVDFAGALCSRQEVTHLNWINWG
jgi:4'-phosphopantetheinyl transferase